MHVSSTRPVISPLKHESNRSRVTSSDIFAAMGIRSLKQMIDQIIRYYVSVRRGLDFNKLIFCIV